MFDDIPTDNASGVLPAADAQPNPEQPELEPLSPEEERFVNFLFEENMNRTRAYRRAYPNSSYDAARSSASRLLAKANIKAEVARRLDEEAMSVEEAVARMARIARGSMRPFLQKGPDGFVYFDLNHPEAEEHMYLVKEMEAKRQRRIVGSGDAAEEWEEEWVRVKLHSAYEANLDILKMHGKFTKKIDLTSDGKPLPPVDQTGYQESMKMFAEAVVNFLGQGDEPKTPDA